MSCHVSELLIGTAKMKIGLNYVYTHSVPRSKHSISIIKTSRLTLYREIIGVCSQIHTKRINTLCGLNFEFVNVKRDGTYSDHWAVKG